MVFKAYQFIKAKKLAIATGAYHDAGAIVMTYYPNQLPAATNGQPTYYPMKQSGMPQPDGQPDSPSCGQRDSEQITA